MDIISIILSELAKPVKLPDELAPFVVGGFSQDSRPYGVISLLRLTQDARFTQVAA